MSEVDMFIIRRQPEVAGRALAALQTAPTAQLQSLSHRLRGVLMSYHLYDSGAALGKLESLLLAKASDRDVRLARAAALTALTHEIEESKARGMHV